MRDPLKKLAKLARRATGREATRGPGRGPPLDDPTVVPAAEATHVSDGDLVLGVEAGGQARAYPWWLVAVPHAVNDVLAGTPIVVLLCRACGSATGFEASIGEQRLMFEAPYIVNGVSILRDRQTGTAWSPLLAMATEGPQRGSRLSPVPVWQMEWGAWRDLYPDSTVAVGSRPEGVRHPFVTEHGRIPQRAVESVEQWDDRLPPTMPVLGVVTPSGQRAYPVADLGEETVLNDEVGGEPVAIFSHPRGGRTAALAFSRVVEGETLAFEAGPDGPVDRRTRSTWTIDGRAVEGPLAGTRLPFVASHVAMWYVWATHFPEIEVREPS